MTFVFNPQAIENTLFTNVMESLKLNPNVMSCGFSTTVPNSIAISIFTLGELQKEEIEKIKLLLNGLLESENPKGEWS